MRSYLKHTLCTLLLCTMMALTNTANAGIPILDVLNHFAASVQSYSYDDSYTNNNGFKHEDSYSKKYKKKKKDDDDYSGGDDDDDYSGGDDDDDRGGDDDDDSNEIPLDGGLSFLAAAGVGLGIKKVRDNMAKKRNK